MQFGAHLKQTYIVQYITPANTRQYELVIIRGPLRWNSRNLD
jgi:hypothetical protein